MGGFGTTVQQLVEIYSKCMVMVNRLKPNGERNHSSSLYPRLGRQLRSDRRKVQEFYSSSLAQSGTSFETGDGMLFIPFVANSMWAYCEQETDSDMV